MFTFTNIFNSKLISLKHHKKFLHILISFAKSTKTLSIFNTGKSNLST